MKTLLKCMFLMFLAAICFYPGQCRSALHDVLDTNIYKSPKKDLFASDDVMNITLSGNLKDLLNDRGEKVQYHPIVLSYKNEDSSQISLNMNAKTRGHFRKSRENCLYPPLLLQFSKSKEAHSSVFDNCNKLKLVVPCKGDKYVIREWMIYRLYSLITPKSFKAKLVTVQFDDIKKKKNIDPFYGILLEEEHQMAKRNHTVAIEKKMMRPEQTETLAFLTMAVFEYLIGNTDWSVQYLQNVKLLATDSTAVPFTVPYDFDHAGLVNAPYAKPAEELELSSVTVRRYRGYCMIDKKEFNKVFTLFEKLKKDIYSLYTNCQLLDIKYKEATLKYFDEFYATIRNIKSVEKEFGYPCDKNGTGNVVIKGLRKD